MGQSIGGDEVHGDRYELSGDFRQATLHFGTGLPALSPEETVALLAEYRAAVLADTTHVDLRGVPLPRAADGRRVDPHLPLERVYVRLRAVREERQRREEEARRREIERQADDPDEAGLAGRLGDFFYDGRADARPADSPIDPEEALREHGRLVVLGPPGAGKSTLLRLLARRAAAVVDGPLPVWVSLGRYTARLSRGDVALADFALEGIPERRRAAVGATVARGGVLWLLDALDEAREHAPRVLAQLATLPGQLALTSRPLGYAPGPAADLPHFDLLPLESGDADAFLTNWFGALAEAQGYDDAWAASRVKATRARLDDRPGLRPLLGNPLLLTFVAVLADRDPAEALPAHRAGLYRRYLEELLDSWEGARRARAGAAELAVGPLRGEGARAALRDGVVWLGWWLHLTYYGGRAARPPLEREAIDALAGYFRAAADYDDLRRHEARAAAGDVVAFWREAGLLDVWQLRAAGGPADLMAFRHLTFQEYGAAVVLAGAWGAGRASTRRVAPDRERAWAFLRPRLHVRAWREPLLLLGGLLGAAEGDALLGAVLATGSPYEAVLRRDLRAGAALAGEGKGQDGPGHMALAQQLVEVIRRERLAPTRSGVIAALPPLSQFFQPTTSIRPARRATTHPRTAWAALVESELLAALRNEEWQVRMAAAVALGRIGDAAAVPWLLAVFGDRDSNVRQVTATALGRIADAAAIPRLLAILGDRDGNVRRAAAMALGRIGDAAAVPRLVAMLRNNIWLDRRAAAEALGRIGDAAAAPGLLMALQDMDGNVRQAAAEALIQIGDMETVSRLLAALQIRDSSLSRSLATALGQIGNAEAVPGLLMALRDGNSNVRRAAVKALARIGDVTAVSGLLAALEDDSDDVRRAASRALGMIGDTAVPGLVAALGDESPYVRLRAAEALGRIGDPSTVAVLLVTLEDNYIDVRRASVEALGRIGAAEAVPSLVMVLDEKDLPMRRAAVEALGRIGDSTVVANLLATLGDQNSRVRRASVEALGRIGDASVVAELLIALEDQNWRVRRSAVNALGRISDATTVPVLLVALQDWNSTVRQTSAVILGQVGNAAVVQGLLVALGDKEYDVCRAAVKALGEIADAAAVPGLLAALADRDRYLRRAAANALGKIGDVAAMPGLLAALRDEGSDVHLAAAEALERIALNSQREPLVAAADEVARAFADPEQFSTIFFRVLESFAARLSTLGAAALPADDLLLPPTPPAGSTLYK